MPRDNRCMYMVHVFNLTLYGGVVSEGYVGFASLDVVRNELHDCT